MLAEKRMSEIIKIVNEKKSITVQELMEEFDASESTIRRDLNTLHAEGYIVKVFGGAIANDTGYSTKDDDVEERQLLNLEDKKSIAKYAALLICDDDFVYLDAGTTTEYMIDYITSKKAVFVTNAVDHARRLVKAGFRAYLIGGELKASTEAIVGKEALISISKYNFTKGFFGANGVNTKEGFTTPELNEAMVKKAAFDKCKDAYVLCDNSKFNQISPITFAAFESAQIITNEVTDLKYKKYANITEVNR